ncbi:bifunctional riboflavin kinase/FMN adenylyltransferase [Bifidobacteriaceae bacterium NR044]|nr:bifunctional riboflavin kinase/FMN adenylyltransferase [Bifidobacteriaceae bacterium NR043]MBF9353603.1 bifunctional riboflavin kinase/FMN adenylyltransferase [Bifidobacteriaceae bacterium NR044]RFT39582.1 bifunctional riboflavin kinase/FMN adenylyltransferase [Bifidobacteriaceae bacterium NR003]
MMKVIDIRPDANGMINWPTLSAERKAVVTIGVFDGMHKGHREVVRRTVELAHRHGAFSVVIMFDPRPSVVHANPDLYDDFGDFNTDLPEDSDALTSVRQRLRVLSELDVDHVVIVRYSLAFAAKSYRFFLGQLVGKLGMRALVLGSDAALGARRAGNIQAIRELSKATGVFELIEVEDLGPEDVRVPDPIVREVPKGSGEPEDPAEGMNKAEYRAWSKSMPNKKVRAWSSTNVRWMLATGRVKAAREILDQPHRVEGTVVHGDERGREIGFPTVNLGEKIEGYIPVDGVYAGWVVDLDSDNKNEMRPTKSTVPDVSVLRRDELHLGVHSPWRWPAAISIGTKPTFNKDGEDEAERTVEAYGLFDDWKDLYGHRVCIEFASFLRPQQAFDSVDELKNMLKANVEQVREITDAEAED